MPGPPTGVISSYTRFREDSGSQPLLSVYTCDEAYSEDMLASGEQNFLGAFDPATHYAYSASPPTGYVATARPAQSAAYSGNNPLADDGADTGTISPIDAAASVTITGTTLAGRPFTLGTVDPWGADDTLEFTATIQGDYTVRIVNFPYADAVFLIEVR